MVLGNSVKVICEMKRLALETLAILFLICSVNSYSSVELENDDTNETELEDITQVDQKQKDTATEPGVGSVDMSSQPATETDNDAEDEQNVEADLKEHDLFSTSTDKDGLLKLRISNHSRLGLLIVDALVKDHLFVLKKGKVELKDKFVGATRASQKLFNVIRDSAYDYYSNLEEVKALKEHENKKVVDGLVALQFNYVCGRVLLNGILTIRKILKDFHDHKELRNKFCRDEKKPTKWKKKRLVKRKKLLQNHYRNKFKTYKEAILARIPEEFRHEKKVPAVKFSSLDEESA